MTARLGTTLIEMLVVLTLMALIASVATLAPRAAERAHRQTPAELLRDSSSAAVREGRVITISTTIDGRLAVATLLPDGRITADPAFHIEPLIGRTAHAP
jgi:prepilin-type N-terminal cleavage/methylation domain-containing protein